MVLTASSLGRRRPGVTWQRRPTSGWLPSGPSRTLTVVRLMAPSRWAWSQVAVGLAFPRQDRTRVLVRGSKNIQKLRLLLLMLFYHDFDFFMLFYFYPHPYPYPIFIYFCLFLFIFIYLFSFIYFHLFIFIYLFSFIYFHFSFLRFIPLVSVR